MSVYFPKSHERIWNQGGDGFNRIIAYGIMVVKHVVGYSTQQDRKTESEERHTFFKNSNLLLSDSAVVSQNLIPFQRIIPKS